MNGATLPNAVALPEIIAVRFTEEEAGYVSMRPVRRQSFRLVELADMILCVAGKDTERVESILRAGAVTYNGYRYSWQGCSVEAGEVASLLAAFPESDASRPFRPEDAASADLVFGQEPPYSPLELTKQETGARRFLRSRSVWDFLLELARVSGPVYSGYSYAQRADLYRRALSPAEAQRFLTDVRACGPRALRRRFLHLPLPEAIVFGCPRVTPAAKPPF